MEWKQESDLGDLSKCAGLNLHTKLLQTESKKCAANKAEVKIVVV